MRVRALRQTRETIDGAAIQDVRVLRVAERSVLAAVDPNAVLRETASPEQARATLPEVASATSPEAMRAPDVDRTTWEYVSENGSNSHRAAIETLLSAEFLGREAGRPEGRWLF